MKIFAVIVAALLLVVLAFADYKWRQWMDARRREQEDEPPNRR
ncbi:MAG: hypothetical protein ACLGPM_12355 [Acidobacteriota bacterium]